MIDLPETDKIRLQESNAALKRALMIDNISDTLIPAWVDDTLTPVEKLLVHQRGLRHLAVSVFLLSGPDVLIQRRALGKYHTPGLWANTCCTHPHWGEDGPSRASIPLEKISGITIGCNEIFEEFTPDYLCAVDYRMMKLLYNSTYTNPVYYR